MGLSDAGAHVGQICDAVMPTDFLANWVRDRDPSRQEIQERGMVVPLPNVGEHRPADCSHVGEGFLHSLHVALHRHP